MYVLVYLGHGSAFSLKKKILKWIVSTETKKKAHLYRNTCLFLSTSAYPRSPPPAPPLLPFPPLYQLRPSPSLHALPSSLPPRPPVAHATAAIPADLLQVAHS